MSKQRRSQRSAVVPGTGRAADESQSHDAQSSLGNAALLAGVHGGHDGGGVDLDLADQALPLVGRAVLALQLLPRDADQIHRFVEILGSSGLDQGRKELLVERLQRDQQAAVTIHEALQSAFSRDDGPLRDALASTLDGVWELLQSGRVEQGLYVDAKGVAHEPAAGALGSGDQGVDDLVALLASTVASSELGGEASGRQVAGVCRSIAMALAFDEEEEEDEEFVEQE